MRILFRSFHNIDVDSSVIELKPIPQEFESFITDYVEYATSNDSVKTYKIHDHNTQVVNCISAILRFLLSGASENNPCEELSRSIADKLLREEINAQESLENLKRKIRKGSLVQACIAQDNAFVYIIAKVENSDWYDSSSLIKNLGFPGDKKNVWKSCVFHISLDGDSISFEDPVEVYTDNTAKYWANRFLELEEMQTDEVNTKRAYDAIESELKRQLFKDHPREYHLLRNSLIMQMRTPQLINYDSFIDDFIGSYTPEETINKDVLLTQLHKLPERKKFDKQFTTVPEQVTAHRKQRFKIKQNIELLVDGALEDFKNDVTTEQASDGTRYIKIKCPDPTTYEVFHSKLS